MKVLLLGVGMQGKAALHDLASSPSVSSVIAADRDRAALEQYVAPRGYGNVTCAEVNASDSASIDRLMALRPDVAIDLLPVPFIGAVARSAVRHKVHLVNTFYVMPEVAALADEAAAKGVTILPEFGMDPGIDLVMLGEAIKRFDKVTEVYSYGAGFPEPSAADNPLKYKIAWTFEGVLRSYLRPARMMHDGKAVEIPATEQFAPAGVRSMEVDGVGTLEAFPNGDALQYIPYLPDASAIKEMGRYTCRWPGHSAFWKKLVDLHFLDEEPIEVDGARVSPRRFLAALLTPQLQYRDNERDVAFLRVDVRGTKDGREKRVIFEVVDRRDLQTGFSAMSRTVGFTASIGAQMIADGTIRGAGLVSPVRDVPWEAFRQALSARGVVIHER